ncbi:hypothetical protein NBO_1326g0001 [Nosema bombycis CQ1]|uniref:Uncharacterized protein n=1 Tax=Nosema bombycis (strain CQ1 / CVCC 102059) TaxID=578461 RepID=R0KKX3_NOSB1|nr:hypothetical protein NBO_1326g0001 [Nosema bombycis CQ1]|eukprot:EOB11271.1 hypothetical protein NBO_1326g0001 [Nosema bombycis CQ1]
MSEYVKTNQIFKIEGPKDVIIRDDLLIVLDSDSNIHIKGLCTVPSFLGEVLKITLRGDFLYLISKDTTIAILNILDMSIIGVYKNINEVISTVVFGNRHIHIITENLLYYKTAYENIKFKRVDCHEKEGKYHFNGLHNSLKNDNTKLLLLKMLSVSPKDESIVYLDVYGTLYYNGESILSLIETVKYIYTTSDKLF